MNLPLQMSQGTFQEQLSANYRSRPPKNQHNVNPNFVCSRASQQVSGQGCIQMSCQPTSSQNSRSLSKTKRKKQKPVQDLQSSRNFSQTISGTKNLTQSIDFQERISQEKRTEKMHKLKNLQLMDYDQKLETFLQSLSESQLKTFDNSVENKENNFNLQNILSPKQHYQSQQPEVFSLNAKSQISKADTLPLSMLSSIQKAPMEMFMQTGETPKFLDQDILKKQQKKQKKLLQEKKAFQMAYQSSSSYNRNQFNSSDSRSGMQACLHCLEISTQVEEKLSQIMQDLGLTLTSAREASASRKQIQSQKKELLDPLLDMLEAISQKLKQAKQDKTKLKEQWKSVFQQKDALDGKVRELEEVYSTITLEKQTLEQERKHINKKKDRFKRKMLQSQSLLTDIQMQLAQIKEEKEILRREVKQCATKEAKKIVQRKLEMSEYDLPLQIQQPAINQPSSLLSPYKRQQKQLMNSCNQCQDLKTKEKELNIKENQLIQVETNLHDKKLRLDAQTQHVDEKLSELQQQKKEVDLNVKQLQILTQNYEDIMKKEEKIDQAHEQIEKEQQKLQGLQNQIQEEHKTLVKERLSIQQTYLNKEKNQNEMLLEKERLQMLLEDQLSHLSIKTDKLQKKEEKIMSLKEQFTKEKSIWKDSIDQHKQKLTQLVEEKKEQISIMEISLRKQIQEVKEKQFELEQKEKQVIRWEIKAKEKLAQEKEQVMSEKEKVALILEELEEKQNMVLSNNMGRRKSCSNSQMPRQMTEKENLPTNSSQIEKSQKVSRKKRSSISNSKTPVIEQVRKELRQSKEREIQAAKQLCFSQPLSPEVLRQAHKSANKQKKQKKRELLANSRNGERAGQIVTQFQHQLKESDISMEQAELLDQLLSVGSEHKDKIEEEVDPNSLSLLLEAEELNYETPSNILNKQSSNLIGGNSELKMKNAQKNLQLHKEEQFSHLAPQVKNFASKQEASGVKKQEFMESDFYYFEQQIEEYESQLKNGMQIRASIIEQEDPLEELAELYGQMDEMEKKFRRVLEICQFMVLKNKELHEVSDGFQKQEQILKTQTTSAENKLTDVEKDFGRTKKENEELHKAYKDLNKKIQELEDEMSIKQEIIDTMKADQTLTQSSMTRQTVGMTKDQQIADLRQKLDKQSKEFRDNQELLEKQTDNLFQSKKDLEFWKVEGKKLKDEKESMLQRIAQFELINEDDQIYILELEEKLNLQEQSIQKLKDLLSKGNYGDTKDKSLIGMNPLLIQKLRNQAKELRDVVDEAQNMSKPGFLDYIKSLSLEKVKLRRQQERKDQKKAKIVTQKVDFPQLSSNKKRRNSIPFVQLQQQPVDQSAQQNITDFSFYPHKDILEQLKQQKTGADDFAIQKSMTIYIKNLFQKQQQGGSGRQAHAQNNRQFEEEEGSQISPQPLIRRKDSFPVVNILQESFTGQSRMDSYRDMRQSRLLGGDRMLDHDNDLAQLDSRRQSFVRNSGTLHQFGNRQTIGQNSFMRQSVLNRQSRIRDALLDDSRINESPNGLLRNGQQSVQVEVREICTQTEHTLISKSIEIQTDEEKFKEYLRQQAFYLNRIDNSVINQDNSQSNTVQINFTSPAMSDKNASKKGQGFEFPSGSSEEAGRFVSPSVKLKPNMQSQISGGSTSVRQSMKGPEQRKEALEEFFLLLLLGIKIQYKDIGKNVQINGEKMFKEVSRMNIPFYEWPKWLESHMNKLYLQFKYRKMNRTKKLLGRKDISKDVVSNYFSSGYEFVENHFYPEQAKKK